MIFFTFVHVLKIKLWFGLWTWYKLNKDVNKLGLSCAKLRPAYTSYPLVFGSLAYAKAAYYAQLCLLELAAAEKKQLHCVGVILSQLQVRNKISWTELCSTQVVLVIS